ncbi:hypothetical protein, conserved [Leishmania tarentolae]|uniref:rRNA methyltransferase 1, mitochondrial n=1 Tax=Leishmania tarentolae TaxID=5689 RepID=A0A640K961_LEITA|nr:hypothetical protein, conserved [Leishmania tarentolae]
MAVHTSVFVLRCTRPLLAYNRSSGYRWSPIPKPPPSHYDRLYGVHSVLNTLRVAAQRQQRQTNPLRKTEDDQPGSTCVANTATSTALDDAHQSSTAATAAPFLHPHRAHLACLYIRDFSLEAGGKGVETLDSCHAEDAMRGTNSGSWPGKRSGCPGRGRHIRKKVIPSRYTAVRCITSLAKSLNVPVRFVPRTELVQLCGERRHQNVVLEASSYRPQRIRHLREIWEAEGAAARTTEPASAGIVTVLFLERIVDPANIGGILRTAFFFGVDHVVLSRQCASCTAAVSRTSTGFLEHLRVYQASTSSAAFLRASHEVWGSTASPSSPIPGTSGLEVIASMVVSQTRAQRRDSGENALELQSSAFDEGTTSEVSVENSSNHVRVCAQQPNTCPSTVRVLLLGNEDAGLPSDLLQWCTHVAHIRSPRQERLRSSRASTQRVCHKEEAEACAVDVEVGATDAQRSSNPLDNTTAASEASAEALDRHQQSLRRLARLRSNEVSLNVNTASAALLSALCGVKGPLGSGGGQLGLVDVQPLCSP